MEKEIDDSFYNRQRYVLGDAAMKLLSKSKIYLHGLSGVGIEIAKNLVLGGVKDLIISDKTVCRDDLGTNFYIPTSGYGDIERDVACVGKLQELNPHVTVSVATHNINELKIPMKTASNQLTLNEISKCGCVILTDCKLDSIGVVQNFCRLTGIKLVVCDVIGLLGACFCDFGEKFVSESYNDEETIEFFIEHVENSSCPVVRTLNLDPHGLNTGDLVVFHDVEGMTELNAKECYVTVENKSEFKLQLDTSEFGVYKRNGICKQKKSSDNHYFDPFYQQIIKPSIINPDFCRQENSAAILTLYLSLKRYHVLHDAYPKFNNEESIHTAFQMFNLLAAHKNQEMTADLRNLATSLITCSSGQLQPLAAVFGGIAAQEAMKAVTHRFTPIKQWLILDCSPVNQMSESHKKTTGMTQYKSKRLQNLHVCLGDKLVDKVRHTRVFMVGCGAIGCELLKNMALLGISGSEEESIENNHGLILVTDNDLIEKSNLNRQFLFKENHIQMSKSEVARQSVMKINPGLHIVAHQNLMCAASENIYTDEFMQSFDICLNALDNVEGRRYMDSRCVSNSIPLLESGTMSTKGHVQVILPHLTENYSSVNDPEGQKEIPYCTLKSFPAKIEHCVEWAREKFQTQFMFHPQATLNYMSKHCNSAITQLENCSLLSSGVNYSELYKADKFFKKRPSNYEECVRLGRRKFQTHFSNKAKQLLHNFPLHTTTEEGLLFWQLPKRAPKIIEFDVNEPLHMQFIISYSRLLAEVNGLSIEADEKEIRDWINCTEVPEFSPNANQTIITDESVKRPEKEPDQTTEDEQKAHENVQNYLRVNKDVKLYPLQFDKDNTSHIEFIAALSNLRARMYSIEEMDTYSIKKISGRIIPAIATSTSVVAGLVCIELLKFLSLNKPYEIVAEKSNQVLSLFRNTFLNLSSTEIIMSEPGPVVKQKVTNNSGGIIEFTVWDKWQVQEQDLLRTSCVEGGDSSEQPKDPNKVTLGCFIKYMNEKYDLTVSMILQKNRIIYFNIRDRGLLKKPLRELLRKDSDSNFTELLVSYTDSNSSEDFNGPSVQYWFMK